MPINSDSAGPNVRDGAPVIAVEVMRACVRDGVLGRVLGADNLGGDAFGELASGTACMKQHRLPYGQEPWVQNVRQISDLNCGKEWRARSQKESGHSATAHGLKYTFGWRATSRSS